MTHWLGRLVRKLSTRLQDPSPAPDQAMAAREAYDRWAATYGDGQNPFQVLEYEAMLSVLPEVAGLKVLDAGCGTGRWSSLLSQRGARVVGFDFSPGMLASARSSTMDSKVPWLAASLAEPLPFRDQSFDAALCALVLGHLEDLERPLAELARVTAPGGTLMLSGFHPFATLRGWRRTFEFQDGERGRGRRSAHIEQHLHLFSDYVRLLGHHGLVIDALEEPCWQDAPVAFALRAVRKS